MIFIGGNLQFVQDAGFMLRKDILLKLKPDIEEQVGILHCLGFDCPLNSSHCCDYMH